MAEEDGPTVEEYWGTISVLGLRRTDIETEKNVVCHTVDGDATSIPKPDDLSPGDRKKTLDKIKIRVGVNLPPPAYN